MNSSDSVPQEGTLKMILYLSFFSYLGYICLYAIISFDIFTPAILAITAYELVHIVYFYLLSKRRMVFVRTAFLTTSVLMLIVLCYFILGAASGVHNYFLAFSLAPLPLNFLKKKTIVITYFLVNVVLFSVLEFSLLPDFSIIDFPEHLQSLFRGKCIVVSYGVVFYFLWYYFNLSLSRESKLVKSNSELTTLNKQLEGAQQQIENHRTRLLKLNDQLEKNLEHTNEQNKALEQANRTKDKFISILAHDLVGPLSALQGLADMLNSRVANYSTEKIKSFTKEISISANNINILVLNLLNWSRAQTGNIKPNKQHFALLEVIMQNENLLAQVLKDKQLDLQVACDPNLKVYADKDMIDTVLRNLLGNAVKFSFKGGIIEVKGGVNGNEIHLQIIDYGVGIEEEKITEITILGKAKSSKGTEEEDGSGLGLIICHEFLKLNNSKLSIRSKVGEGSVFTMQFPNG